MKTLSRMIAPIVRLAAALTLAWCTTQSRADDLDTQLRDASWAEIGDTAKRFVAEESPDTVWPFQREALKTLASSPRKVIVNYMPHLPISIENKPIDADTWSVHFLQRSGQGNKYARFGGLARRRPLPAGPWPSPYWREIDAAIDVLRARLVGADAFAIDILHSPVARGVEMGDGNPSEVRANDYVERQWRGDRVCPLQRLAVPVLRYQCLLHPVVQVGAGTVHHQGRHLPFAPHADLRSKQDPDAGR